MGEGDGSLRLINGGVEDRGPVRDRRVVVRVATEMDTEWIMTQVPAIIDFYGTRIPPFPKTPAKLRPAINCLIRKHLVLIAESTFGMPLGFIGGFVSPGFFNPDILILQETIWWIEPGSRDGRAAFKLFNAFCDWGDRHVDWISVTLEDNSPIRPGHLEQYGFKLKEHSYLREVLRG